MRYFKIYLVIEELSYMLKVFVNIFESESYFWEHGHLIATGGEDKGQRDGQHQVFHAMN